MNNRKQSDSGTSEEHILSIAPDGTLRYIHSDSLAGLEVIGSAETHRASDVEMNNETRTWEADMRKSGHDVRLTGFKLRSEALAAERRFLEENVL